MVYWGSEFTMQVWPTVIGEDEGGQREREKESEIENERLKMCD